MLTLVFLDSLNVFAGLGIDTDDIALVDEHRDIDVGTRFERYHLAAALCGIAAGIRRRFGNFELDFDRKLHAEKFVIEPQGFDLGIVFEEFAGFADKLIGNGKALRLVLDVMEKPFSTSFVNKYGWLCLNLGFLQFVGLLEGILDRVAADEVPELGLIDRPALLLLHDVVPRAHVRLAVDQDRNSRFYFVVIQHSAYFIRKMLFVHRYAIISS